MAEETIFNQEDEQDDESKAMNYPIASTRLCTVWLSEDDNKDVYLSVKVEPPHIAPFSYNVYPTEKAEDFLNKIRDAWIDQLRQRGVVE